MKKYIIIAVLLGMCGVAYAGVTYEKEDGKLKVTQPISKTYDISDIKQNIQYLQSEITNSQQRIVDCTKQIADLEKLLVEAEKVGIDTKSK